MISTHRLGNITISEDHTSVTVGSGVTLNEIYATLQQYNLFMVAGSAATVHAAGGYIQGAGHSAFSPLLGLAADNTLGDHTFTFDLQLADYS
jgi:FAD/FMN-containing dehydrogenase